MYYLGLFTIRLFLKSQRKNLDGLFTGCTHFMFLILLATFEKNTRETFKVCGVEIPGKPV